MVEKTKLSWKAKVGLLLTVVICIVLNVVHIALRRSNARISVSHPLYQQFRIEQCFPKLGAGIMFFAYGRNEQTFQKFAEEVIFAAREFKRLAPSIPLAVATSSKLSEFEGIFDHIIDIDPQYDFLGSNYQKRPDSISRQWLTRILYMTATPFELTLAYDSNVTPCTPLHDAFHDLKTSNFDFSTASVGAESSLVSQAFPHNFAIAYRWNKQVSSMFGAWFTEQIRAGVSKDDQNTLHRVLRQKPFHNLVRKTLSPALGLAFASTKRSDHFWPRETRVASTPISVFHANPRGEHGLCELFNMNASVQRQFVKTGGSSVVRTVYSAAECAEALGTSCLYTRLWDDLGLSDLAPLKE